MSYTEETLVDCRWYHLLVGPLILVPHQRGTHTWPHLKGHTKESLKSEDPLRVLCGPFSVLMSTQLMTRDKLKEESYKRTQQPQVVIKGSHINGLRGKHKQQRG